MLQARSLASVFWLTLQNLLAAILLVAIPAVLAHLLTPEDLGLLEIALAFFGLATLFMELGTGPAIIQRPAIDETFLSTVFGVNVATGVIFALVLIAGAPAITGWLRMDRPVDWHSSLARRHAHSALDGDRLSQSSRTTPVVSARHAGRRGCGRSRDHRRPLRIVARSRRGADGWLSRLRHRGDDGAVDRSSAGGRRRGPTSAWCGRCCVSACLSPQRRCSTTCRFRAIAS